MLKNSNETIDILFICKRHEEMRKNNDKIKKNIAIRALRKVMNEIKYKTLLIN